MYTGMLKLCCYCCRQVLDELESELSQFLDTLNESSDVELIANRNESLLLSQILNSPTQGTTVAYSLAGRKMFIVYVDSGSCDLPRSTVCLLII